MTKYIFILTFLCVSVLHSQTTDTLIFGPKKYALKKTKVFHETSQLGPVILPSEYQSVNNPRKLTVKYKMLNDTSNGVFNDEDGNEIWVSRWGDKNYPFLNNETYLPSFTDTIFVTLKEFYRLRPFIKVNTKKVYFTASNTVRVYNDTARKAYHSYLKEGYILTYWQSSDYNNRDTLKVKNSSFIVRDLYYAKGTSTYYLDRQFLIKIR